MQASRERAASVTHRMPPALCSRIALSTLIPTPLLQARCGSAGRSDQGRAAASWIQILHCIWIS